MKSSILLLLIFITANLCAAQTARKTVTNADLEKYRQARLKSEADYRANYKKLGMPSPEELEQSRVEKRAEAEENLRQITKQGVRDENYFQTQANELRANIVGVQAEINYLRGQISTLPNRNSILLGSTQIYSGGIAPYGNYQSNRNFPRQRSGAPIRAPRTLTPRLNPPRVARPPVVNSPFPGGVRITTNPTNVIRRGNYGYRQPNYYGGYYPPVLVPYAADYNSYERTDLVSRLRELEQAKAGLLAQFELLQDEARRAGVRID